MPPQEALQQAQQAIPQAPTDLIQTAMAIPQPEPSRSVPPPEPGNSLGPLAEKPPKRDNSFQAQMVPALFDYTAEHPDELSFQKGEYLSILGPADDPGWMMGMDREQRKGLVPITHIRVTGSEAAATITEVRIAAFAYNPEYSDELAFKAGQEIGIVSISKDPGWYHAVIGDQQGVVPVTHLKPAGAQ
mmetsp:Transcript_18615/g.28982  ORF Transcript_18615/g.28982 Transcript_18615/m.28982 type:complete len:188 (+) Transcript_18615:73-636(+)